MHRITESLTELLWELYLVILVEELPNRNCFGINSVIILCAMVIVEKLVVIACAGSSKKNDVLRLRS